MNKKIEKLKGFRLHLLKQITGLTTQQLNHIPAGYNNNIAWHLGHLTGVMQNMCYARSGLPFTVDEKYISPYLPGTKPERLIDEQEIKTIKELSVTSIDQLQADCARGLFVNYSPSVMIPKVYGFEVSDIYEAIDYLLHHEGLHAGYILSMKRLL